MDEKRHNLIVGNNYWVSFENLKDEQTYHIKAKFLSQNGKLMDFYDEMTDDTFVISELQIKQINPVKKKRLGA